MIQPSLWELLVYLQRKRQGALIKPRLTNLILTTKKLITTYSPIFNVPIICGQDGSQPRDKHQDTLNMTISASCMKAIVCSANRLSTANSPYCIYAHGNMANNTLHEEVELALKQSLTAAIAQQTGSQCSATPWVCVQRQIPRQRDGHVSSLINASMTVQRGEQPPRCTPFQSTHSFAILHGEAPDAKHLVC